METKRMFDEGNIYLRGPGQLCPSSSSGMSRRRHEPHDGQACAATLLGVVRVFQPFNHRTQVVLPQLQRASRSRTNSSEKGEVCPGAGRPL